MKRFAVAAVAQICLWLSQAVIRVIAAKEVFIAFAGLIIALWYGAFPAYAAGNSQTAIPDGEYYYEVRKGDTLSQLAEAWLDSPAEWQTIATTNDIAAPKQLKAGTFIKVPMGNDAYLWRSWFHGRPNGDQPWLPAPQSHIQADLDGDSVMEQIAFDPGRVYFTIDEEKDQAIEHELMMVIKGKKKPNRVLGRHLLKKTNTASGIEWALLWALPGNEWLMAVEIWNDHQAATASQSSDVVFILISQELVVEIVHGINEAFWSSGGGDSGVTKTFSLVPLKNEGNILFQVTERMDLFENLQVSKTENTYYLVWEQEQKKMLKRDNAP